MAYNEEAIQFYEEALKIRKSQEHPNDLLVRFLEKINLKKPILNFVFLFKDY